MRLLWKRFALLMLAMIVLLGAGTVVWLTRTKGPKKPASIPRGDYSYATDVARYRVEHVMKQRHIPGAAVLMIDDEEIIWQAHLGVADIEQGTPVSGDTVFKLWSLAKPFTATEVMRLVEEGRLDLDAPLDEYVPEFSIQSRFPRREPITLRNILAHRSGLPRNGCDYTFGWETGRGALEQLAVALEGCFLAYPTGNRYKYSNIGYVTMGYIIQAERERPFPLYMRDELLAPIGMANSAFWSRELPPGSQLALGYEHYKDEYHPYVQEDVGQIPSSNLYATSDDLAAFVKLVFRDGEAGGVQLIQPETLRAMFVDQYSRAADPQPMGLGWKLGRVAGNELLAWHDGGPTEGIGSLIAMLPERKLAVVLLGNAVTFEGSVSLPIAAEILEAMLEARDGVTVSEKAPAEAVAVATSDLQGYTGGYAAFGDILEVSVDGDRLKGSIQDMRFDLVPIAENQFRVSHWMLTLGLADLLQLPMDLGALEITFQKGEEPWSDHMIINFGDLNFEINPRYAPLPERSPWKALVGKYDVYGRLPSGLPGPERLGERVIRWEDGRLIMSGGAGPVLPLDDNTVIILSGPFHGETVSRDPEAGTLTHQGFVLQPAVHAME